MASDYDSFAEAYSAENEASLLNAYFERPAMVQLARHYLEDWGPALAELRRVLKPGGRLLGSVEHPSAITLMHVQAGREECLGPAGCSIRH